MGIIKMKGAGFFGFGLVCLINLSRFCHITDAFHRAQFSFANTVKPAGISPLHRAQQGTFKPIPLHHIGVRREFMVNMWQNDINPRTNKNKMRDARDRPQDYIYRNVGIILNCFFLLLFITGKLGGFIVGTLNAFFLFITIGPLVGYVLLKGLVGYLTVQKPCPVCSTMVTAQKGQQKQCFNCRSILYCDQTGDLYLGTAQDAASRSRVSTRRSSGVIDAEIIDN
mmetsp:Transcript_2278/g.3165  ORF Transcript_2278/g.3165 Transcript_2278/m.3165 type:complete len:225 (+) Transcript_2278:64-738(+)